MDSELWITEFERLRTLWERTRGGRGGKAALAGFDFQLNRALVDILTTRSKLNSHVIVEGLSDIAIAALSGGPIIVAQAKLTLSSSGLKYALQELWDIDVFAKTHTPDIAQFISYMVIANNKVLQNEGGAVRRWRPAVGEPLEEVLSSFKERVVITVKSHPRIEAARILLHEYKDTKALETVDRMVGKLLQIYRNPSVVEEINHELESLLEESKRKARRFDLWSDEDRPPARVEYEPDIRRAVCVGQVLTRHHLREGCLASRPLYQEVASETEDWLASRLNQTTKIPAFWIQGASGSGKSAALLHLLAHIHEDDRSRIILWLGSDVDALHEAIAWSRQLIREGKDVIIAIDDPFSLNKASRFAANLVDAHREWLQIAASGPVTGVEQMTVPSLICCGPTEQREMAEEHCLAHLEITSLTLPAETAGDISFLTDWYSSRTGRPVQQLPESTLLVQRFFEWSHGDLGEFAKSFKQRLTAFDEKGEVFESVAEILAMCRLYAEYPAQHLLSHLEAAPHIDAAFRQLREDSHLFYLPGGLVGSSVRLAHPHLADAIYRKWFGKPGDAGHRKRHLRRGLRASLDLDAPNPSVRYAPLWSISRIRKLMRRSSGRVSAELVERFALVDAELRDLLRELYQEFAASGEPFADLPVWVVLNQELNLSLCPAPSTRLRSELARVSLPRTGLRLSCHIILDDRTAPEGARVDRRLVADLLLKLQGSERRGFWSEWPPVAAQLVPYPEFDSLEAATRRLVTTQAGWPAVARLAYALAGAPDTPPRRRLLLAWLANAPIDRDSWPEILLMMRNNIGYFEKFAQLAMRFLGQRPNSLYWCKIWNLTLQDNPNLYDELISRATAWIGAQPSSQFPTASFDIDNWSEMFRDILNLVERDIEVSKAVYQVGLKWLNTASWGRETWSYVWNLAWTKSEHYNATKQLAELGDSWLDQQSGHRGWPFVWGALNSYRHQLSRRSGSDDNLRRGRGNHQIRGAADLVAQNQLRTWLDKASPAHPGWSYVWNNLISSPGGATDEILDLGERWLLQSHAERYSWLLVGQKLARQSLSRRRGAARIATAVAVSADRNLGRRSLALELWLGIAERGDEGPSPTMVEQWLRDTPAADEDFGMVWLVASRLGVNISNSQESKSNIYRWLSRYSIKSEQWYLILSKYFDIFGWRGEMNSEFQEIGYQWLLRNADHFHFAQTWKLIVRIGGDHEIRERIIDLGYVWLLDHTHWAVDWPEVWSQIVNLSPELGRSPELRQAAADWMNRADAPARLRKHIHKIYRKLDADNPSGLGAGPISPSGFLMLSSGRALDMTFAAASAWLSEAPPSAPDWRSVWVQLAATSVTPEDLNLAVDIADGWLLENQGNSSWLIVWGVRLALRPEEPEVRGGLHASAVRWLAENPELDPGEVVDWHCRVETVRESLRSLESSHDDWPVEFLRLAKQDGVRGAPEILRAANDELEVLRRSGTDVEADDYWWHVEQELNRLEASANGVGYIGASMIHALVVDSINNKGWPHRWETSLNKSTREFRNLYFDIGFDWLNKEENFSLDWPRLWFVFWREFVSSRAQLIKLGERWLAGGGRKDVDVKGVIKRIGA